MVVFLQRQADINMTATLETSAERESEFILLSHLKCNSQSIDTSEDLSITGYERAYFSMQGCALQSCASSAEYELHIYLLGSSLMGIWLQFGIRKCLGCHVQPAGCLPAGPTELLPALSLQFRFLDNNKVSQVTDKEAVYDIYIYACMCNPFLYIAGIDLKCILQIGDNFQNGDVLEASFWFMLILVEGHGRHVISQSQGDLIVGGWDMASSSLPSSMGYATMWDGYLFHRIGEPFYLTVMNIGVWALDHDRNSNKQSLQLRQGPFSKQSRNVCRLWSVQVNHKILWQDCHWTWGNHLVWRWSLATKTSKVLKFQALLQRTIRHLRPSKCDHLLLL